MRAHRVIRGGSYINRTYVSRTLLGAADVPGYLHYRTPDWSWFGNRGWNRGFRIVAKRRKKP